MLGHSRCHLYETQEVTIEHLLNSCIFTDRTWDFFTNIFKQSDREKESIANTLNNWRNNFSDNEVLNSSWELLLSFIIWNVWKERNKRIFKEVKTASLSLVELIVKQLKETFGTTVRILPKIPPSVEELRILQLLDMQGVIPQGIDKKESMRDNVEEFWHPPPDGFLKYNIDGASKGNSGEAGFGGVLRDDTGCIISLFHGHLGKATNNMAELMALEQSLEFLIQNNCQNVIIEADSELVINAAKRISNGTGPEKVTKQWRLTQVLHRIQAHLQELRTLRFIHVRRKANKLADILANQGVSCKDSAIFKRWNTMAQSNLKKLCHNQAKEDKEEYRSKMIESN